MALSNDLRYALRLQARRPGLTLVSLILLTLGIGATTAVFSIVYDVLLDPLPYPAAEELVKVWNQKIRQEEPRMLVSPPEYLDYREAKSLELAAYYPWSYSLTDEGEPERLNAVVATASLFEVLDVGAEIGRVFDESDDRPGHERVAVLHHGFWQRRFGGDRGVLRRELVLDGDPYAVIGVMPPGFEFPGPEGDLWLPMALDPATMPGRKAHQLQVVGRLAPGVSLPEAKAEMQTVAARLANEFPEVYPADSGWNVDVVPLLEELVGETRPALLLLISAVGLVLLIACVNVANLLLVQGVRRRREVAVRTALGAGRARLIRQFLVESLLLAIAGGAAGLALGLAGSRILAVLAGSEIPRLESIEIRIPVVLFALGLSLATGLLFGLAPALRTSRVPLVESLKESGRGGSLGGLRNRLRSSLVVAEVALSLVLLIGAGLMIKSFMQLQSVDPGFRAEGVLVGELVLPYSKYPEAAGYREFFDRLLRDLEASSGVEAVGAIAVPPFSEEVVWSGSATPDVPGADALDEVARVEVFPATPGIAEALGMPILAGRFLSEWDTAESPDVAVVGEELARRYWPEGGPVGERIKLGGPDSDSPWLEIVGVVPHLHRQALDVESPAQVYIPLSQTPFRWPGLMGVVARTSDDPAGLVPVVRQRLREQDPDLPFSTLVPMEQQLAESMARSRFVLWLLTGFAVLALILAAVGLYGVLAYVVSQRTGEFGLRMALGARRRHVLVEVLSQAMVLVGSGLVLGLAAAWALTRLMSSLLFEVSATDPAVFLLVTLFLALVALAACQLPARRALRVDPAAALRSE